MSNGKLFLGLGAGILASAILVSVDPGARPAEAQVVERTAPAGWALVQDATPYEDYDTVLLGVGLTEDKCREIAGKSNEGMPGFVRADCVPIPTEPTIGFPASVKVRFDAP